MSAGKLKKRVVQAILETPVGRTRVRRLRLFYRLRFGWSASHIAERVGYSRSYWKAIEGGSKRASATFATRFRNLERESEVIYGYKRFRGDLLIVSEHAARFPRVGALEILARPVKCDGCGQWFVPRQPRQKRHANATCRQRARSKSQEGRKDRGG